MSESEGPWQHPFQTAFRASLLLLGTVIALNLTVACLRPLLPWLIGMLVLAAVIWVVVAVVRLRRSQW
ncbi:hypothetical protein [Thermomonospora umbrina]|uniref:Uncharacterized protein n=1 Tax=Thermomonospora umbrina TaxID=111806 RepID=A0A3D9SQ82_9ACTN|nr:hypothetical protein [Thermomonospora umbrina]REE94734.1 hypothetical protein DFJ69_0084 [Thermomonospora umbrina]